MPTTRPWRELYERMVDRRRAAAEWSELCNRKARMPMLDENKVTVRKDELLTKLKYNREHHIAEYRDAIEGYHLKLLGSLKALVEELELGKDVDLKNIVMMAKPVSHADDYERVIAMLAMSVADTITLREDQFQSYCMDEWDWKSHHRSVSQAYSSGR